MQRLRQRQALRNSVGRHPRVQPGRAVELGSVDDVFYRPRMPYTVGLLNSLPRMDTDEKLRLTPIVGSPPSLQSLPPGCPFRERCGYANDACLEAPQMRPAGGATQAVRCFHPLISLY